MNIPQGCDEWFRWISRLQVFQESTRSDSAAVCVKRTQRDCVTDEKLSIFAADTGVLADFV